MYAAKYPDYVNATKYNPGPFLKLVFSRLYNGMMMDQKQRKYGDEAEKIYKFYLYGGHDSGVVPIIGALDYNITTWVSYSSMISFELFKKVGTDNYFVLLSYNGQILAPSYCDSDVNAYKLCSWSRYESWMRTVTPSQSECPGMRNVDSLEDLKRKYRQK
eukprot:UN09172